MQDIKVFVAFDGDKIGRQIGRASMNDHPEELRRLSQAIENGNNIWKAWALAAGGSVISLGGDEGRIEIPASKLEDLPRLRNEYMQAVGSSVSVGVGQKLSECEKGLVVAKIRGGNQIVLYTKDLEEEIKEKLSPKPANEVDKLAEAYTKSEKPVILRKAAPTPWTPDGLLSELHPIAFLESNYGRNLNRFQSHLGPMLSPLGALGMKPAMALQEYKHNPQLRNQFQKMDLNDDIFCSFLQRNHAFYNAVANALWTRLKRSLGNHAHRAAYAWRWSYIKARQTPDSVIARDPYVNKYLSMKKGMKEVLDMYKHELDFLPMIKAFVPTDGSILESPDGGMHSPSAGGGMSPPQQEPQQPEQSSAGFNAAPEHSEGEAAQNYFAENAPGSPEQTHNPADMERMMHEAAAQGHDQDQQQQVQEQQEQEGDDKKEDLKSEIVKVLQKFKQQAPVVEQLKEQAPDLYASLMQVMQAFVSLAQEVIGGDDASQQTETNENAEGSESDKPDQSASDDSEDSGSESKPKEDSDTKKHEQLVVLQEKLAKIQQLIKDDETCKSCKGTGKKKQGYDKRDDKVKEVTCKACNGTGSSKIDKADLPATHHHLNLPVGSQMAPQGKIKVQHKEDGVTGKKTNPGKTGWIQARAGMVLSNDGHPISSRNPGGR